MDTERSGIAFVPMFMYNWKRYDNVVFNRDHCLCRYLRESAIARSDRRQRWLDVGKNYLIDYGCFISEYGFN